MHRHHDAEAFLRRAEARLLQHEAEHNLLLGLAHRLTPSTEGYESPIYLATVDEGLRFCFLYTDLANPTSNSIYQRIGYKPVCAVLDYDFDTLEGKA